MKIKILSVLFVILFIFISLIGCTSSISYYSYDLPGHNKMGFSYLNGTQSEAIKAKKGQTIVLNYETKVTKGDLSINMYDPDKKDVAQIETNSIGTKEILAKKDGIYHMKIYAKKARGNYNLKWKVK